MKKFRLNDMKKGWFVGDFLPSVYRLRGCEVACKYYKAGDYERRHIHKVATEITLVAAGFVQMNSQKFTIGDIIVLESGESTDFKALENSISVVIKIPSVKDDKYYLE